MAIVFVNRFPRYWLVGLEVSPLPVTLTLINYYYYYYINILLLLGCILNLDMNLSYSFKLVLDSLGHNVMSLVCRHKLCCLIILVSLIFLDLLLKIRCPWFNDFQVLKNDTLVSFGAPVLFLLFIVELLVYVGVWIPWFSHVGG